MVIPFFRTVHTFKSLNVIAAEEVAKANATKVGIAPGIGIERHITPKLSVELVDSYERYRPIKKKLTYSGVLYNIKSRSSTRKAMVGIKYHF